MTRSIAQSEALDAYLANHANPASDPVSEQLAATTVDRFGGAAQMNIGGDQGRFFTMLVAMSNAKTVVEVGTFTGMSALWLARGLPSDGSLLCFDITDKYLETATEAWIAGGVNDQIEVRIGPAADGLAALPLEPHIDLAFIDADKGGYRNYLDLILPRLSPNGTIIADNVLWSGSVVDDADTSENTEAIRDFNRYVAEHPDLNAVILPVGDGITLIRKR